MSLSLGTDLWDKPASIITFNENNTLIVERLQKIISEFCKGQLTSTYSQKKLLEKFMNENESLKKSEFNFSSNAYFLSQQICEIINAQETFSDAFLNEVEEIIKSKLNNIKKESRKMKNEKKKLADDLTKENQKLNNDFKNYRQRYKVMDDAYFASIKAEENKALSRNQVDDYHTVYLSRKSQYEDARKEYMETLDNFNKFQSKYYSNLIDEWGSKAQKIENERYNVLRSTFTNLSELCRSMASKFTEIADRIELKTDTIEYEKDCLTLIDQEKTGDVPPRDIPFTDFDFVEKNELLSFDEARVSKISTNSGSDSTSSNTDKQKFSIDNIKKVTRSLYRSSASVPNKENGTLLNGHSSSSSKLFGKFFGGPKKTKEPAVQVLYSNVDKLESLKEEKCAQNTDNEPLDDCDNVTETVKNSEETLIDECSESKKPAGKKRMFFFRSMRQHSNAKSFDEQITSRVQKSRSIFRKTGRKASSQIEKCRSKSVSSIVLDKSELDKEENQYEPVKPPRRITTERKGLKPKLIQRHSLKSLTMPYSDHNRDPLAIKGAHSLTIEAVLPRSPVEIVSTPAEAMAIVARLSLLSSSEHEPIRESEEDSVKSKDDIDPMVIQKELYEYYYVGSCVAIHDYINTDPSNMYVSFSAGQQFYIVKDSVTNANSGWLLVESLDRSQSGYVPASYMDTRQFDKSVPMVSDHPLLIT